MNDKKPSSTIMKAIIIISVIVITIALYLLIAIPKTQKPLAGYGSSTQSDIQIGGAFELTDQDGKIFNSNSLKGKLSLIYFGFTFCPDICPTSLQKITEVVDTLGKYKIIVTPVFITIDPKRDTYEILKEYLKHFHPAFIGLTGTDTQIKQVADKFKVYYAIAHNNANKPNYMVDHSSFVYLMDKDGKYIRHFYMSSTPAEIIEFIRVYNQGLKN